METESSESSDLSELSEIVESSEPSTSPIKMRDVSVTDGSQAPQVSFQTKELESLLDLIDKLRAQGVSRFIDLPQMIVCGDQSSGKSSVLEAVSGVRFPTKDNLCTRFPTELILRRSLETSTSITIVPDPARPDEEQAMLREFSAGAEDINDFGGIVERAGQTMGLDRESKVFSNDVLRIELTGPKLPHLTLVDLPGLFHAGNKNQSTEDAAAIKALVTEYMKKPRSIILAVVSAKNDYANQIVTKFAHDVDPTGKRTLGIITKPDTLHAGSESETQFFELAENKDVVLRLGWHVLKNRDFDTRHSSADERDRAEAEFFGQGIWTSLPPTQMGIDALKPRLSRILRQQILVELPNLINDVQNGLRDCESRLERLGVSRATLPEQRTYLYQVSQSFSKLIQDAVAGRYNDPYFGDGSGESYDKRIRAVIANRLDDFAEHMRTQGAQFVVTDDGSDLPMPLVDCEARGLTCVTQQERLEGVAELIKKNRGLELPGFPKFETITTLFRQQCTPWEGWAKSYQADIFHAAQKAIYLALDHTADQDTKEGILRMLINPALDDIKAELERKLNQNLQQHVKGHPITFNRYFTDNIQELRNQHQAQILESKLRGFLNCQNLPSETAYDHHFALAGLVQALTIDAEEHMSEYACSEALHYMEAYYEVAIKFFIDDFGIHTIEQGLLEKLEGIFDPIKVFALPDKTVKSMASESEESIAERTSSSTKLSALKEALRLLRQLEHSRS